MLASGGERTGERGEVRAVQQPVAVRVAGGGEPARVDPAPDGVGADAEQGGGFADPEPPLLHAAEPYTRQLRGRQGVLPRIRLAPAAPGPAPAASPGPALAVLIMEWAALAPACRAAHPMINRAVGRPGPD